MGNKKKNWTWWHALIIAIIVVVGLYGIYEYGGGKEFLRKFKDIVPSQSSGVHDPNPGEDDECEKRPDCYH